MICWMHGKIREVDAGLYERKFFLTDDAFTRTLYEMKEAVERQG